ncbi:hypothetical protein [Microbacterium testaceum]|uniref:hypothetical protein n=1 Tax=Microbacterium testaceum TaxID=2033 RepID=UPI000733F97B|nr:hypothetical protein [Microbacterium testaceum]
MNTVDERGFRRLLRWYPRSWRQLNGEVFIATLLEAADADGRSEPTRAERRSALLHGVGAHVDRRLAVSLSLAALLLAAALSATTMFGTVGDATFATVGYPVLATFAIPVLTATALTSAIRARGWISDTRALSMIGVSAVALALAGLASISWGLGFDAADSGALPPPLAQGWGALVITSIVAGAIVLALLTDSLLQRTTCPPILRIVASLCIAVVTAPVLGLALLTPTLSALVAMTTLVMSLMPGRRERPPVDERKRVPQPARALAPEAAGSRRVPIIQGCALVAVLGGTTGVAFALTGSLWAPGAIDATQAMQLGIVMLLVSALPLLVGFGTQIHENRRVRHRHTWGPILVSGISLVLLAIGYLRGPEWEPIAPWFFSGSLSAGVAVTWWITPRVRLPRPAALVIGSSAGLLYAAIGGFMATPLLAFTVPVWALILLTRKGNPRRSGRVVGKPQFSALTEKPSAL